MTPAVCHSLSVNVEPRKSQASINTRPHQWLVTCFEETTIKLHRLVPWHGLATTHAAYT